MTLWRGQYILPLEFQYACHYKDCCMLCESRVNSCAILACSHYMHAYLFLLFFFLFYYLFTLESYAKDLLKIMNKYMCEAAPG